MNTKDNQRVSAICTPCTPLVVKRLLYHYMSADTPKDSDIDTMSESLFLQFCECGAVWPVIFIGCAPL